MKKIEHKSSNATPSKVRKRDTTGTSSKAPNLAQVRDKQQRAIKLRIHGANYRRIAIELDVAPSTVHKWVMDILAATPLEGREQLRQMENERVDNLRAQWASASSSDVAAARLMLSAIDMSCKINGLYAPTQFEDVTPPAEAKEALIERLSRLAGEALKR